MAQTVNGQKKGTPQKQYRPGQRQQERLQRQARRRRRQRLWTASIAAVVLIALSVAGYIEYQRYTSDRAAAQLASANATATKVARNQAAAIAQCLAGLHSTPTPAAGPTKPPAVNGNPVTLSDGLQYIDIQVGCGPAAQKGSNVSMQYTGWLQKTGKKFDSSWDHSAQPITIVLGQGQVIKGFEEGLSGMKRGGIRRLIIPAALAYGAAGRPPTIPPNSVLIFDVTMVSMG
jgi:FKBP-type peptidyl-prolyl cis-trans isomerase